MDELFLPGQRLRGEVVEHCTFLVAYAVSVDGGNPSPTSEFQKTLRALREVRPMSRIVFPWVYRRRADHTGQSLIFKVLRALDGAELGTLSPSICATVFEFTSYPGAEDIKQNQHRNG